QSLVARRIGNLHFVTVASPHYLKTYGTPTQPRDLERGRHHVVNFFAGNTRRIEPLEFSKDGETLEIHAPYRVSVNDSDAITGAVLAGFGVSQVVTVLAAPHLARGE